MQADIIVQEGRADCLKFTYLDGVEQDTAAARARDDFINTCILTCRRRSFGGVHNVLWSSLKRFRFIHYLCSRMW